MKGFVLQRCFLQVIPQVYNPRKTRVFSFIRLMWQIFKHILISLSSPSSCLSQTQIDFHSKPYQFQVQISAKSLQRYVILQSFHSFLRLCRKFFLGYFIWGFCKKGWVYWFWSKFLQIFYWALSQLSCFLCVSPMWQF